MNRTVTGITTLGGNGPRSNSNMKPVYTPSTANYMVLVSLFNGILTFVDYLMLKPFL